MLRFTAPDGRAQSVPLLFLRRIDPKSAAELPSRPSIVMAKYLSRSVRAVLTERGANFADATGNIRLALDEPGLFMLTTGATSNPWPEKRTGSLQGIKAGRVVRVLSTHRPPIGIRTLAEFANTDPGYVSRLTKLLEREGILSRRPRGPVTEVDWRRLLLRWSEDAPLQARAESTTWLQPRGPRRVIEQLRSVDLPYLVTGSGAAARIAPVAPARLLSIYVEDPDQAAAALGLRPADTGANVVLLHPRDGDIFTSYIEADGLYLPPHFVIAADLLTGPGRSPAEAEALIDWMKDNEDAWHG